jgi:hypothetical protein
MRGTIVVLVMLWATDAAAQRWQDATASCTGVTGEWSNEVDLADVDGDGLVDILVANGGDYDTPGTAVPSRVWKNLGGWEQPGVHCQEISAQALLGFTGLARTIRAVDVDKDGDLDIITGGAYQSQLRLFLRDANGWTDGTAKLPQQATAVHDVEAGDVDGDGDLDLLLSDTGATNPTPGAAGGRTKLYLNDGAGNFSDVTTTNMPDILVRWSWDVELVDVDNDWDLDALVSCKRCTSTSYLFRNDGTGKFTDDPNALPHFTNNYEFEAIDIDNDGDLDLATINDGMNIRDHIFVNDGTGKYTDGSATRLTGTANPSTDDNAVVFIDVDSDGDPDMFTASLSGADRLNLNDGNGVFTLSPNATPDDTPGSLAIATADLNGDNRVDLVQAQGESADPEKVQLGSDTVAIDTQPPKIERVTAIDGKVVARVHDNRSPLRAHDFQRVWVETNGTETTMSWYGEYLWRADVAAGASLRVCAKDRAGNQICSDGGQPEVDGAPDADGVPEMPGGGGGGGGGCCDSRGHSSSLLFGVVLMIVLRRRRR